MITDEIRDVLTLALAELADDRFYNTRYLLERMWADLCTINEDKDRLWRELEALKQAEG